MKGKREWLAGRLANACIALAGRSVRLRLLVADVAARIFLWDAITLPEEQPPNAIDDARVAQYNGAAEAYFDRVPSPEGLLRKPFSESLEFPRRLFDVGVLLHWMRVRPGHVVLELGAGSCWLSHMLNRFGCRTISVDVSPSALELGKRLFAEDPATRWELEPKFLPYDSHRLPVATDSVDRVLVYDAFHHVPNPGPVLAELCRVLRPGGIVGMREPGGLHSDAETSVAETRDWGVFEGSVDPRTLDRLATEAGFSSTTVIPVTLKHALEVPARDLSEFLRGKFLYAYWKRLSQDLRDQSFLLLYNGSRTSDSRNPGTLAAEITVLRGEGPIAPAERLRVRLRNVGDTIWLSNPESALGCVQLGLSLHNHRQGGSLVDRDWARRPLPRDVPPGGELELEVDLPSPADPGSYQVLIDLVAEEIAWFSNLGTEPAVIRLDAI